MEKVVTQPRHQCRTVIRQRAAPNPPSRSPQDINVIANKYFRMLSANVPAASGFGVAFLLGLRYG